MANLVARTEDQKRLALEKLNAYINSARERSGPALARIMNEVPRDRIVRANALTFEADYEIGGVRYIAGERAESPTRNVEIVSPRPGAVVPYSGIVAEGIHNNAMGQIADKTGIPMAYIRHLQETAQSGGSAGRWALDLLARSLGDHFRNMDPGTRFLTRSVGGQTRALLSDKFRRIDCRPGLSTLVDVASEAGAIVGDAVATDTRVSVRIILPTVHEIAPGEYVIVGITWDNSDFGRGAQSLRMFVMRLWCWNGAVLETAMREVHLGRRLSEEITYSDETQDLDARATVGAIRDTARHLLGSVKVDETTAMLKAAALQGIEPKTKVEALRKKVGKGLADQVAEAYNRPDVEDLPPGNTAWRWSNALSWVAGHTEDPETRIDLERLAGDALKAA